MVHPYPTVGSAWRDVAAGFRCFARNASTFGITQKRPASCAERGWACNSFGPVERVVDRVAGLRRADIVVQADVDQHRAADPRREVDAVEVVERLAHLGLALRVEPQVVVDLLVRPGVRQRGRVHEAAEVGRAGRAAGDRHRAAARRW